MGDIDEDTIATFTIQDLLAGWSDPDGFDLVILPDSVLSENGTITLTDDTYTFTPFENFSGPTQINFTVVDVAGRQVATSKYLQVNPINDPLPELTDLADAEDFKEKSYLIPLVDIFTDVPDAANLDFDILNNPALLRLRLLVIPLKSIFLLVLLTI